MARIGLFGRRTEEQSTPTAVGTAHVVDRDRDGRDDRDTDAADRARHRVEAKEERLVDRDRAGYAGRAADTKTADRNRDGVVDEDEARAAHERTQSRLANRERMAARDRVDARTEARNRTGTTAVVDRDRDGVDDRAQARPVAEPRFRARASMIATLSLLVGLTSVYAALTGRLAPAAVALGVLGLILSFGGMTATGRPKVAGGGLALLALLLSVGGAVLGVLAMNHVTPWLDSDVDQVARWRDWLDANLPFIRGW